MAYSAKDFFRNPLSLKASVIWSGLGTAILLTLAVIMLAMFVATKANAQVFPGQQPQNSFRVCGDMTQMSERLRDKYGETIQMILPNAMSPNVGGQTILTANIETGTWSIVVIGPDYPDLMCMIQNGNDFDPSLFQINPPPDDWAAEDEGDPT
jgi:hypothetical protein